MTEFLNQHLYEKFSYASILNNEHEVLYHTDVSKIGKHPNDEIYNKIVFDDRVKNAIVSVDKYYEMVIPVVDPKEFIVAGTVNIGIEKNIVDSKVFDMIARNIGILILSILLAVVILSLFLKRNITDPIGALGKKIRHISCYIPLRR